MVFDLDDLFENSNENEQTDALITSNAPIFLCKVWQLVNDEKNKELVGWSTAGNSFIIHDPVGLSSFRTWYLYNNLG